VVSDVPLDDFDPSSSIAAPNTLATHSTIATLPEPVLPFSQAMGLSKEELWNELQRVHQQNSVLIASNQMVTLQLEAANTHCTLAKQALSQSRLELDNVKKKQPRQSVKLRARFVTMPELLEDYEKSELKRQEKEKLEAEKQAKKNADEDARQLQIERDIRGKTFDALSTFRRKDDYITLAGALGISRDGTVEELKTRIKGYLADPSHVDIAQNPRFSALFQVSGKTCARNPPIMNNTHSQEPALNFDPMVSHLSFSIVDSPSLQPQAIREHTQTYPHYTAWPQDDIYDTYTYFSHPVPTTSQFDGYQVASSSNLKRQSL
jgi:hypothetical protein